MAEKYFTVTTPNGEQYEFPEGTSPQEVYDAINRHQEERAKAKAASPETMPTAPLVGDMAPPARGSVSMPEGTTMERGVPVSPRVPQAYTTQGEAATAAMQSEAIQKHPVAARALSYARGIPFVGSRADELVGYATEKGVPIFDGLNPEEATQTARFLQDAMSEQRPNEAFFGQLAAGLASGVGAAKAVSAVPGVSSGANALASYMRGTPLVARVGAPALATSAGMGLEGYIYGSGEGETDLERARNAESGAWTGAGLGLALGVPGYLAAGAARNINRAAKTASEGVASGIGGISKAASRKVEDAILADLKSGSKFKGGYVANLGPATRARLDATISGNMAAASKALTVMRDGMEAASDRIFKALDTYVGENRNVREIYKNIDADSAPSRRYAYNTFYSSEIDRGSDAWKRVSRVLSDIPDSVMRDAVDAANMEMRAEARRLGMNIEPRTIAIPDMADPAAKKKFIEELSPRHIDEIKKALGEIAYSPANKDFATGAITPQGRRIDMLRGELRDGLMNLPGKSGEYYRNAMDIAGDVFDNRKAFELGQGVFSKKVTEEDISDFVKKTTTTGASVPENIKARFLAGVSQSLRTDLEHLRRIATDVSADENTVREALELSKRMSTAAEKKLAIVMGANDAKAFIKEIRNASDVFELGAHVAANAKTAFRGQIHAQDMAEESYTIGQTARDFASGSAAAPAKRTAEVAFGNTPIDKLKRRDVVQQDIARALLDYGYKGSGGSLPDFVQRNTALRRTIEENAANFGTKASVAAQLLGALGLRSGSENFSD